jgi:hypothetical protein
MTGGERLARAVLLWHRSGSWTDDYRAEWEALTGSSEATSVTLCNLAREVLADEQERSRGR